MLTTLANMDVHMSSGVLAFIMDSMFRYGSLWIFIEHLEGVRKVMTEEGMDGRLLDQAIATGYQHMVAIHAKVQAQVRQFHMLLGYCETTATIIIVDDEMD